MLLWDNITVNHRPFFIHLITEQAQKSVMRQLWRQICSNEPSAALSGVSSECGKGSCLFTCLNFWAHMITTGSKRFPTAAHYTSSWHKAKLQNDLHRVRQAGWKNAQERECKVCVYEGERENRTVINNDKFWAHTNISCTCSVLYEFHCHILCSYY